MEKTERRQYARYSTQGLDLQCKMMYASEARLVNLSVGGAYLAVDKRVRIGSQYTLHIGSEDRLITLKGLVVREVLAGVRRNEKGEMIPQYEVGLQFENVLTDPGRDLLNFIEDRTKSERQRIRIRGTRVRVLDGRRTLLDMYKNFAIKRIGMGGLLMEADQKMEEEKAFDMELHLADEDAPLKIRARVAYCDEIPGRTPAVFDTGVEFLQISKEDIEKLNAFIATLSENNVHG